MAVSNGSSAAGWEAWAVAGLSHAVAAGHERSSSARHAVNAIAALPGEAAYAVTVHGARFVAHTGCRPSSTRGYA